MNEYFEGTSMFLLMFAYFVDRFQSGRLTFTVAFKSRQYCCARELRIRILDGHSEGRWSSDKYLNLLVLLHSCRFRMR